MTNLDQLRKEIDSIDLNLLELLEKRFQTVKKIAETKQKINLPTQSIDREDEIIDSWLSHKKLCSTEFITQLVQLILHESRQFQEKLKK